MLSDTEICALLDREAEEAREYSEDVIGKEAARNIRYYLRRPRGDEVSGRSRVISSDVADTVNQLLPALLDTFAGSDRALEAVARGPEDVAAADQATEACNYVFYGQCNGYMVLHSWLKDGLLAKVGIVKAYPARESVLKEERYQGLTQDEFAKLQADADVQVLQAQEHIDGVLGVPVYDVLARRKREAMRLRIDTVPFEEILVCDDARSPDIGEARYVRHVTQKTKAQLIADGFDAALVESLGDGDDGDVTSHPLWLQRRRNDDGDEEDKEDVIWVEEHYICADLDEDGIDEKRQIVKVGSTILANEVVDEWPFASWTPKPLPHEFAGECPADEAVEFQDLNTTLWRQSLDNLYQVNAPRWRVIRAANVNYDELLNVRPSGIVSMDTADGATPLVVPAVLRDTFQMMEYTDGRRELRTGVARVQGIEAPSINKTATGASIVNSKAEQQVRMIARNFAEIGLKRLFRLILRFLAQHQSEPMIIRLRNTYVPVDPRAWATDYDFTINVGLGTNDKTQRLQQVTAMIQAQYAALQAGMANVLVTPANMYEAHAELSKLSGYKDPSKFWTEPQQEGQGVPPQVQQQMQQMQAMLQQAQQQMQAMQQQNQALQAEKQSKEIDARVKMTEAATDAQIREKELQIQQQELALKAAESYRQAAQEMLNLQRQAEMRAAEEGATVQQSAQQAQAQQLLMASMAKIEQLMQVLSGPRQVVRDAGGNIVGVSPAATAPAV